VRLRRKLKLPTLAPLFCTVSNPGAGNHVNSAYLREVVRDAAKAAEIDKHVNPSTLIRTHKQLVAQRAGLVVAHLAAQIDEAGFGSRYPTAYKKWRDAFDLYQLHPERHAGRIGHDCRDAISAFTAALAEEHGVHYDASASNTKRPVGEVFAAIPGLSSRVRDFLKALLKYWEAVSDLTMRQDHAATQATTLTAEDSRRLVFQTLLVMTEIDSVLRRHS
jgi:hypothetical protein